MARRQLTPEFREFLGCLNRAKVEDLLVGGFAVNHYRDRQAVVDAIPASRISLGDLQIHNKASGRHKDLANLENLPSV